MVKFNPLITALFLNAFQVKEWPGVVDMPEYQNMKRLDPSVCFRFCGFCQTYQM